MPSFVPEVPKVSNGMVWELLASKVYNSLFVVMALGFSTSISVSLLARSPAPDAVYFYGLKRSGWVNFEIKIHNLLSHSIESDVF